MSRLVVFGILVVGLSGCGKSSTRPDLVWGTRGINDGDLVKPRAAAIDASGNLYIIDFTARIQKFACDGKFLGPCWTTPDFRVGRPSGLSIDRDGNLLVSDSHYHCLRIYSPQGKELRKVGGESGSGDGQFSYISDAVQDADGFFYVAEFGENQRITKLALDGSFVKHWGSPGAGPAQFARIRALALGPDGLIYAADSCNHRIQAFTPDGELKCCWGQQGDAPGQLSYPYDLAFDPWGALYVVEFGTHRVQKFTATGEHLGTFGGPGREPGRFFSPWALAVDRRGRVHVMDSENHRVQRLRF